MEGVMIELFQMSPAEWVGFAVCSLILCWMGVSCYRYERASV